MIVGYRCWEICEVDGKPRLKSPYHNRFYWSPTDAMAFCDKCTKVFSMGMLEFTDTKMQESCSCGLYARKTPEKVIEDGYTNGILGEIFLYGKVIIGEEGYRAEHAKVHTFFMPTFRYVHPDAILALAKEYNANIVKSEGELYRMICKVRDTNMPWAIHKDTSSMPKDRNGHTYWGESNAPSYSRYDSTHREVLVDADLRPRVFFNPYDAMRKKLNKGVAT